LFNLLTSPTIYDTSFIYASPLKKEPDLRPLTKEKSHYTNRFFCSIDLQHLERGLGDGQEVLEGAGLREEMASTSQ
jgi:hypothetical protein